MTCCGVPAAVDARGRVGSSNGERGRCSRRLAEVRAQFSKGLTRMVSWGRASGGQRRHSSLHPRTLKHCPVRTDWIIRSSSAETESGSVPAATAATTALSSDRSSSETPSRSICTPGCVDASRCSHAVCRRPVSASAFDRHQAVSAARSRRCFTIATRSSVSTDSGSVGHRPDALSSGKSDRGLLRTQAVQAAVAGCWTP